MPKNYGFIIHIALLFFITLLARPASAQDVTDATTYQLTLSSELSREGYFVVTLDQLPQKGLRIQQSSDVDFAVIDSEFAWFGDFEKMTLTGFSDGDYYFRIKPDGRLQSNVATIQVAHYPGWQAYSLFFIGLGLFVLLVTLIISLHLRSLKHQEEA
ncbi:hypothetical protein [Pseudidiomarina insulisalsae]|uniref:Uncharacterized protein n=1 Tax=Pseudidiomarina insulisalsae TaxID=575789 RepID=A0A432YMF4_9GAMM|nr:hypothetical protein [Pseudidiomarina insulisalsae]RUO62102.1 hypothetical protein CWI71_04420 [Pseudidiomarina insulisalsae]